MTTSGDTDPRPCECSGPRRLVQGMDRRKGHPEQVLTFCRRCNGVVTNRQDIELFVEPTDATATTTS